MWGATFSTAGTKQDNKATSYDLYIVYINTNLATILLNLNLLNFCLFTVYTSYDFELVLFISISSILARVSMIDSR